MLINIIILNMLTILIIVILIIYIITCTGNTEKTFLPFPLTSELGPVPVLYDEPVCKVQLNFPGR